MKNTLIDNSANLKMVDTLKTCLKTDDYNELTTAKYEQDGMTKTIRGGFRCWILLQSLPTKTIMQKLIFIGNTLKQS